MTRGEEIHIAASKYVEENSINGYVAITDHKDSFIEGAQWADAHSKTSWISVKDKLPCDDKEMVMKYVAGLETRTKLVCVLLENGFIDMTYMYKLPPCGWHWNIRDTITHWFPLPEPPK